jgi:hypothetical protein
MREAMGEEGEANAMPSNTKCRIVELDDVIFKDVGGKLKEDGRGGALMVDLSKQAALFFQYNDTNYLNCCNPRHMEPETIRLAVLGALRFGKPVVVSIVGTLSVTTSMVSS